MRNHCRHTKSHETFTGHLAPEEPFQQHGKQPTPTYRLSYKNDKKGIYTPACWNIWREKHLNL